MYAPRHGNEARSMLVLATSVILLVTLRVEGNAANYTEAVNSTVATTAPLPTSNVAGFIVLLCVLVVAVCASIATCCISGVWKALRKNSHSHTQSQIEAQNGGDLIPRPPSQLAVTSPSVKRPQPPNNLYTLQPLPRQQMRPPLPNTLRNGHARHHSVSNPSHVLPTPSMLPPFGSHMYSFRDKSTSSHSSDSALVQYSTQTNGSVGASSATLPIDPTPTLSMAGLRRNSRDTPV